MKRQERVLGLLLGLSIAGLLSAYVACLEKRPRNPNSPSNEVVAAPAASATTSPAPLAETPDDGGRELNFYNRGIVSIKNTTSQPQNYMLCSFRISANGHEERAGFSTSVTAPGDTWHTQGLAECSQLDMIQPPQTCDDFTTILGAAFYNSVGMKKRSSSEVDWYNCHPSPTPTPRTTPTPTPKPSPTPTPKPSPTPTPCSKWKHTKGCKY